MFYGYGFSTKCRRLKYLAHSNKYTSQYCEIQKFSADFQSYNSRVKSKRSRIYLWSYWAKTVFLTCSIDDKEKMSLSRNGTLEKAMSEQTHSELGSPSRAGSGLVVPPPYSPGGSEGADTPLELRGSLDCWACSVLVTAQNLIIALVNGGLASVIFGTILTPALVMIIFGFLCHSTVTIPFFYCRLVLCPNSNTYSHNKICHAGWFLKLIYKKSFALTRYDDVDLSIKL